ncbi:MAG: S16 family serine protease [Verrucomicrobiota bacterium]
MRNSLSYKKKRGDEYVSKGDISETLVVFWEQDLAQIFKSLFYYSGFTSRLAVGLGLMTVLIARPLLAQLEESPIDYKDRIPLVIEDLGLTEQQRTELVETLVGVSKGSLLSGENENAAKEYRNGILRALALALKLNPRNREAVIIGVQAYKGAEIRTKEDQPLNLDKNLRFLLQTATQLKNSEKPHDIKLAGYLFDIGVNLFPAHEDFIYESEMMKLDKKMPFWPGQEVKVASNDIESPKEDTKPFEPTRLQSSIKGLFVTTNSSGLSAGTTGDILIHYQEEQNTSVLAKFRKRETLKDTEEKQEEEPEEEDIEEEPEVGGLVDEEELEAAKQEYEEAKDKINELRKQGASSSELQDAYKEYRRTRERYHKLKRKLEEGSDTPAKTPERVKTNEVKSNIGSQMAIALDEGLRMIKTRHQNVTHGGYFEFSFGDKYTPKDGGSAGTAFSLLMESIVTGIELDESMSVTGDITIDGKVRAVGGIPHKINGSVSSDCGITIIPAVNASEIVDYSILYGLGGLLDTQVIIVETFNETLKFASKEKDPDIQEALNHYANIPRVISRKFVLEDLRRHPEHIKTIQETYEKIPNHQSAKIIIEHLLGRGKNKLSLSTSIEEALRATGPFLHPVVNGFKISNRTTYVDTYSEDVYKNSVNRLNFLGSHVDPQVKELCEVLYQFVSSWRNFSEGGGADQKYYGQELLELRVEALEEVKRLNYDQNLLEELVR